MCQEGGDIKEIFWVILSAFWLLGTGEDNSV